MKEFTVTLKVTGPDEMTAKTVAGIIDDAMCESMERNSEDPTHPDVEISDARVRETFRPVRSVEEIRRDTAGGQS